MQSQPPTIAAASKRTVSLAIAIILLIVGVAAGAGATYVATRPSTTPLSNNALCYSSLITNPGGCVTLCTSGQTINIGELLDLSKTLSDQGIRAKDSSALAINDINSFLSQGGCTGLKFATLIDDYALDNNQALTQLQSLKALGVQVVVGPLNSGAAQYILAYANTNHIVLISPSSTSPALAIPNDYLFRTAPNDAAQGLADARMLVDRGASAVIIVQRHETYGDGLANATEARFKALGGKVIDKIQYDATAADAGTLDWTPTLSTLNNDFTTNVGTYGAGKIAIDVVAFEEFGSMIIKAQSAYPTAFPWSTLPWFGTDGEADNGKIISGSAGTLAAQVKIVSTLFSTTNNTKSNALYQTFSSKYPGLTCDSYCLGAYDDVWLAAISTLQAGAYDGTVIQANMLSVAATTYGATGPMTLQPSGDRLPTSYQIWEVVNQGGIKWIQAGTWVNSSDSITWNAGSP